MLGLASPLSRWDGVTVRPPLRHAADRQLHLWARHREAATAHRVRPGHCIPCCLHSPAQSLHPSWERAGSNAPKPWQTLHSCARDTSLLSCGLPGYTQRHQDREGGLTDRVLVGVESRVGRRVARGRGGGHLCDSGEGCAAATRRPAVGDLQHHRRERDGHLLVGRRAQDFWNVLWARKRTVTQHGGVC